MRSITIRDIRYYPIALDFVEPLRTSFGVEPFKAAIIVEVITEEGVTGWGEVPTEIGPLYAAETMGTAIHILRNFISPALIAQTISNPSEAVHLMRWTRGNHLARHGVETAIWDALAKVNDMRLVDLIAHYTPQGHTTRGYATVGVSIGIQPTVEDTLAIIGKRLSQGYGRIKLKIKPGWDVELARAVRQRFPDILLMLDANSAYTLEDADHLRQLDDLDLLMIEQPLAYDDIYEHSKLQPMLKTPLCLDESIKCVSDLNVALALEACRIINLKPSRVGGFVESLAIYRVCVENQIPLWIGGMLETGVGRAGIVAFASLPGVTLPCDISATDRYFDPDIVEPPFVLNDDSTLTVPDGYGIGVEVHRDRIEEAAAKWSEQNPYIKEV